MPTIKGDKTKTFLLKSESHKLHEEFVVKTAKTVSAFGPVVLNTDGTVENAAADAAAKTIMGFSLQDGTADEVVTVMTKAYAQTFGFAAGGAIVAGPVKLAATENADGYLGFANIAAGTTEDALIVGWALDAGAQNDIVRIAWTA